MSLALIVAMSNNHVIGQNNQLPWHLPNDLKYFKSITLGKPVIMGRKTHESIGFVLPGRPNIVVSRNPANKDATNKHKDNLYWVQSLEAAINKAHQFTHQQDVDEIMIIGGAQMYGQALAKVNKIYLTQVDCHLEGDAFFPAIPKEQWQETARDNRTACANNPYAHSFIVYERIVP